MKRVTLLVFLALLINNKSVSQAIPPAPNDKAVVYFARPAMLGFVVEFFYYDSASFIARANNTNYVRYECEPGFHIFWGKSENVSFLEAELEAGKIYFIEVIPRMSMLVADVELNAVDPAKDEKAMNRILKLMEKKSPVTMTEEAMKKESQRSQEPIIKSLEKYRQRKEAGKKIDRLEKDMFYKS